MERKESYRDILIYLFLPEDSSTGAGRSPCPGQGREAVCPGVLGLMKAALWGMIAVGLPIFIAMFCR